MKKLFPIIIILLFLWSCQGKQSDENSHSEPLSFSLTEVWRTDSVMKTPESVLYDPVRDILFVANMNLPEEGNTGFISTMKPDGTIINLNWVDGLIQPRGMAINGSLLFATDMNRLIIIDIDKAELIKTVPVDSAKFLNDLAISKEGTVYFGDSRGGKLHKYENDSVVDWFPEYENPNGLFDEGDDLIVGATGAAEVRRMKKATGEHEVLASGIYVDGIAYSGFEEYYIVSEWGGRIHMIGNDSIQTILDTSEKLNESGKKINSADFGYNLEKKVIYLPTFFDNRIVAYKLEAE